MATVYNTYTIVADAGAGPAPFLDRQRVHVARRRTRFDSNIFMPGISANRPTMKDVAKLAGVSLNVVSRVCRPEDNEAVSASARGRVLAAVEELGYHPDSRARSLRNQRTNTIGFFIAYNWLSVEGSAFARSIYEGLQAGCSSARQDLLFIHGMNLGSDKEIVRELNNAKVDGVVYLPNIGERGLSETLLCIQKPMIRIGEPHSGMPTIVTEDHYGGQRLARHLYLRGHRRVLFRMPPYSLTTAERRRDGFAETAEELGMTVVTTLTESLCDELSSEERQLLNSIRSERITAAACWRDESAAQLLVFCRESGIHVPDDLAVVGFDGLTPSFCPPDLRLTTVVIDWQRITETAVATLIDIIEGKAAPDEVVQPCSIYLGNTT